MATPETKLSELDEDEFDESISDWKALGLAVQRIMMAAHFIGTFRHVNAAS